MYRGLIFEHGDTTFNLGSPNEHSKSDETVEPWT
jgi:hypothetical protein